MIIHHCPPHSITWYNPFLEKNLIERLKNIENCVNRLIKFTNIQTENASDVKQKFIPKPYTAGFTIGENQTELQRYVIQFFGLQLNEKIKSVGQ